MSRSVKGKSLRQQVLATIQNLQVGNLHTVLCQRACLISTYHCYSTHSLTGMQLSHKIIALQHTSHVEGKGKGYSHRQSFRHSHHDERKSHHEILQHHFCHLEIVIGVPQRINEYVVYEEYNKRGDRQRNAELTDYLCQPVELHGKRRLHICCLRTLASHLAYFGLIANRSDAVFSSAVHHHRAAKHLVYGVCTFVFFAAISAPDSLFRYRFSRKRRLIHLQVDSFQQLSVSRNLVTCLYQYNIADHYFTAWNLYYMTVSSHLHRLFLADRGKHVELLGGILFKDETYCRGKEYCNKDTDCFYKVVFYKCQYQRNDSRNKQYLNYRVFVFLKI